MSCSVRLSKVCILFLSQEHHDQIIVIPFMSFCILTTFVCAADRVDDGDDVPWTQHNRRTGQGPVLRADRFHRADEQKEKASQACMGIRVNIWNKAKVSRLITRSLTGGGPHQVLGYDALDLDFIKQGDAGGGLGSYAVLCNLPDKVAKYLLEFHPNDYMGLGLPAIPDGASSGDIHKMLNAGQVLLCCLHIVFQLI